MNSASSHREEKNVSLIRHNKLRARTYECEYDMYISICENLYTYLK